MTNRRFAAALLSAAAGPALLAFATPVAAQQAAETAAADSSDTIVVTGIRASLDAAAKLKRQAPTIVEAISAEDIGKLPDVSIADSLARLPGVTAQRLEGRDQRLSIRGLGPEFSTTLLNGREQVTVGDNRGVEYDQYPSEFFQNVIVHKSADASLIPAGIAGTVDLRQLRPLDASKRIVQFGLRGEMNGDDKLNPDGNRFGYRASATYVDQFADDTFGVALGVSATSTPSQDERYNAWGFPNDANGNLILGGAKPYVQSNVLDRYGAVGTFEYRPNDNWHSTLDVLYSHFEETQHLRGIEFPLQWSSAQATNITTNNGFDTQATFTGVHGVQRNDVNQRKADQFSIGWNNEIRLNEKLRLTVDASWSHSKRTDFLLENYTGVGYAGSGPNDTVTVTQQPNNTFKIVPTLDYTNTSIFKITDPQGWGYNGTTPVVQAGFLNKPQFKDDLKALRADLDGDFGSGLLHGWQVGVNFSQRTKDSNFLSYFLCPKGGGTNCTVASGTPTSAPIPQQAIIGTVPLGYLGVPGVLALDPFYLYNNAYNQAYDNRPVSLVRDNRVKEDVLTGYAMLKIDGDVGVPVKGSIGAQVVHSHQESDGSISNFDSTTGAVTIVPVHGSANYTYFLPSLVTSFEVAPQTYVKFGAARTMVRARLDQERINQEFHTNFQYLGSPDPAHSFFSSTGGNVALRPYLSDNIDLSIEKYFSKGGYVSVAGYYKDLSNYVDPNDNFIYDFKAAVAAFPPALQTEILKGTTLGTVSAPSNRGGGHLEGVEATLSLPFSLLTPSLEGFGFFGSGSYTDSKIVLQSNPTGVLTLPGLSDWVANAQLYYERYGFKARVSYRYRSAFLAEVAGLSANPTFRTAKAESIVDAQIGYEFQPGSALAGLAILFEAKNLTDRPFVTYEANDPRRVIDYQRYGRTYYLGFSYKF
jgi:iron complex outermembrane receptor protein